MNAGRPLIGTLGTFALSNKYPHIALVATGGTIAGRADDVRFASQYSAGVLDVADICAMVPGLSGIAQISAEQFTNLDSKDIDLEIWRRLAMQVNRIAGLPDVDGLVIMHGTDTLEETAFLLHLVAKTDKPIVLTGAMRPANAISPDGPMNLYDAVTVAAARSARQKGVLVVLDNRIHGARDVTKSYTLGAAAFSSGEQGALGRVQDGDVVFHHCTLQPHTTTSMFSIDDGLTPVEIVVGYGGVSCAALEGVLSTGAKGIVVAGVGGGALPEALAQRLAVASASGVAVVRASRIGSGPVLRNAAAVDGMLGFIAAGSLSAYKARILLMLALSLRPRPDSTVLQGLFDRY